MATKSSLFASKEIVRRFMLPTGGKDLPHAALVCLAYFVAGRLGLAVPFTSGNVSPIWPASGVALTAILLLGYRVWPGIALGAFLVNLFSPIPHYATAGIAVGNTLAAVTGAFLVRRIPAFRPTLSRLRDVLGLIALGALVSPIVSASIGVAVLFATNVQPWSAIPLAWFIYWLGDAMGVLLLTPLALTFSSVFTVSRRGKAELASLIVMLTLASFVIFEPSLVIPVKRDVLAFGIFPFVIWAAIRFGVAGSSLALVVIAAIATTETALGSGPFAHNSPFQNAALLQIYFAVLAISGLSLAAVIAEREQAEAEREHLIREQVAQAALRERSSSSSPNILRLLFGG